MIVRTTRTVFFALSLAVTALAVLASGSAYGQDSSTQQTESPYLKTLTDGPGKSALVRLCSSCHAVDEVASTRLSRQGWAEKVDEMFREGAEGSDEDVALVVEYLFSILPARLDINKATDKDLRMLLGLSETDSAAVVAYRRRFGPFKKWQDLAHVPGVNFKKIQERSEILVVG